MTAEHRERTITDTADRDALLRYLDLRNDLSDIVNRYLDLPLVVVHQTLLAKAHEMGAAANLPKKYQAPARKDQTDE